MHSLCVNANLPMSRMTPGQFSILVAERELIARESLAELFRFDGHRVHEAGDSEAAIALLRKDPMIKVILLDVQMLAWRMVVTHARGNLQAPIIVGMGTLDDSSAMKEIQRHGVHEYLLKPLWFDHICETISWLMAGRHIR